MWQVIRITLPPQYYKPGIYKGIQNSIQRQLIQSGNLERALQAGWLQEVRPTQGKTPMRRFVIYLTDKKRYHDIPISFSLKFQNKILRP